MNASVGRFTPIKEIVDATPDKNNYVVRRIENEYNEEHGNISRYFHSDKGNKRGGKNNNDVDRSRRTGGQDGGVDSKSGNTPNGGRNTSGSNSDALQVSQHKHIAGENDKGKASRDIDRTYLDAVKRGDMKTAKEITLPLDFL